jgi:hypothetical protein
MALARAVPNFACSEDQQLLTMPASAKDFWNLTIPDSRRIPIFSDLTSSFD